MTDGLTDGELIRRFKDGDDSGFMRLVERYQDIMFRLSVGQGFDEEQAADITQEVFMRAWSRLRKWKPGKGKPFTWLFRTMMNIWSETRRKPRMVSGFSHPEHSELSTGKTGDSMHELSAIRRIVLALPTRQRQVIWLHFFEDMSLRDTADLLGIPVGTVKSNYHKALVALRRAYDDREGLIAADPKTSRKRI